MARHKNRYIPYKVFHKIWDEAYRHDAKREYIEALTGVKSDIRIDFMNKYGISENKAYDLLSYVFDIRSMKFKEILKQAKKRKADVSHELCIPIRTIEDWCNEKSNIPGYTKLLILRQYGLFKLPSGIAIGSEPEPKAKTQKKKEVPAISERELTRSINHRTYIEEQRIIEEHKRARDMADDPLSMYLRKKRQAQ